MACRSKRVLILQHEDYSEESEAVYSKLEGTGSLHPMDLSDVVLESDVKGSIREKLKHAIDKSDAILLLCSPRMRDCVDEKKTHYFEIDGTKVELDGQLISDCLRTENLRRKFIPICFAHLPRDFYQHGKDKLIVFARKDALSNSTLDCGINQLVTMVTELSF